MRLRANMSKLGPLVIVSAMLAATVLGVLAIGQKEQPAEAQAEVRRETTPRVYTPDEMLVVLGFQVEMPGSEGSEPDSAWETATGGSLNIEVADSSTGSDQFHTTTPGHKYVDTLILRGPLTSGRHTVVTFEIQGAPQASKNVESITVEDLVIDEREMTTGADWDYRVYGPGDAHFGSITIRSRVGKNSKELYQWWQASSRGQNIRKSITINLKTTDGSESRRYEFLECVPVSYTPFVLDGSSNVSLEEVEARCSQIAMHADGPRKALIEWITETVKGKDWKRQVTVKEILKDGSAGKTFTYLDCFPTRYVFPAFSASGTGNLYEEVNIKPIRLELG